MNFENIVTINVNFKPEDYAIKYNLILLENSKITTQGLIELFESFYKQCQSYTFIFDFSSDVNNLIDFTPIMDYVEEHGYPGWSYHVCNPIWLGNTGAPTAPTMQAQPVELCSIGETDTTQRLNICSDIVQSFFGKYGVCKIENVYCDMQEE